ncbi:MAG: hypothetical protein R3C44_06560 [Chloroflexota bacterium]
MGPWLALILGALGGGVIAAILTWYFTKPKVEATIAATEAELSAKRVATERESEAILKASREEAQEIRAEAEKVIERRYEDLARSRRACRSTKR